MYTSIKKINTFEKLREWMSGDTNMTNEELIEKLLKPEDDILMTVVQWEDELVALDLINLSLEFNEEKGTEKLMKAHINGETCLMASIRDEKWKIFDLLISFVTVENKKDFIMKEDESGNTSLMKSAKKGNLSVTKLLTSFVENEEDFLTFIMKENETGYTALMFASEEGNEDVVDYLLTLLKQNNNEKLIESMIHQNKFGETALILTLKNLKRTGKEYHNIAHQLVSTLEDADAMTKKGYYFR